MSSGVRIAALPPGAIAPAATAAEDRPVVRLAAFGALGLYGVVRWETLLSPAPEARELGLLAVALALAAAGEWLRERARPVLVALGVIGAISLLPISGVPLDWVLHVRIAFTLRAIGQGLSALPSALVPYNGVNQSIRLITVLGAGVLLLDAGLMLALAPRALGDLRRAGAALPLVALAVVPSTLLRPKHAYLEGLILFVLLAAFIWGERIRNHNAAMGLSLAALAAAVGMMVAPALDEHSPWLNYQALAGALSPRHSESFDWSQRYGPLNWPRTATEVIDVQARRPDYWKAEDLDVFDGVGWSEGQVPASRVPTPAAVELARWTQKIQVTIRAMKSTELIAAGVASAPIHLSQDVFGGYGPGTWKVSSQLEPGDSYQVSTYSPSPSPVQLTAAGSERSPRTLAGYRSILVPRAVGVGVPPTVIFPPFQSGLPVIDVADLYGPNGAALVESSPYARAYALARRLGTGAATQYAFVARVEDYLQHGYTYNEDPPVSRFPLLSFLFKDKVGYCQQFAGAMALLLRMGGVPARVAAGFATGNYDSSSHQWVVSDLDAHAWVEAWFPRYGWVRFDPTPSAAPARGGTGVLPGLAAGPDSQHPAPVKHHDPGGLTPVGRVKAHGGGFPLGTVMAALALAVAAAAIIVLSLRRPAAPSAEQLIAELERALARSGRPLASGVTLAALERRLRGAPEAAAYIRTLRLAKFAGRSEFPTAEQRRALRAYLRAGLGLAGRLRALWALPPRRWRLSGASDQPAGEIHS